jgi:hypothetical protein
MPRYRTFVTFTPTGAPCAVHALELEGLVSEEEAIGAMVADALDCSWGLECGAEERAATYADYRDGTFTVHRQQD